MAPPTSATSAPARRWAGLTLYQRIQLLVVAFLAVLALSAVFGALSVRTRDRVMERVTRYDTATEHIDTLLTAFIDQETGVHDYVLTQDEDLLVRYREGRDLAMERLDALRTLLGDDDPRLLAAVGAVEASAADWTRRAAEPEIEATAAGRTAMATAIVAAGTSAERFDRLRADITHLRAEIRGEQLRADAQLGEARRRLNAALTVSVSAGALLLLASSAAMQRWSTQPLAEISAAARDVAGGDLQRRIPAVGPSDIAALGEDAEQMRRRIVTELDGARRAEQALRSQGMIVNLLRSELSPTRGPLPAQLSAAAALEPVKGVLAGDWYDIVALDADRVALCLIDVSGHGQATGVFALQAKNLLLAGLRLDLPPGEALTFVARALGDTGDSFLTCFVARIRSSEGTCEYASAGHLPALVTRSGAVDAIGPTGPLLGPLPGQWETVKVALSPGSLLVAYTDGITEARGPGQAEFGEERLRAVVAARADKTPHDVVGTVMDTVHDFLRGEPSDDMTLVALRWLP